jgi:predicted RNase H-like HicB family nuclease
MTDIQIEETRVFMNKMKKAGLITMIDLDEWGEECPHNTATAKKAGKKKAPKEYSLQFSVMWKAIPGWITAGKSKPKTFEAFKNVIKAGHDPDVIIKAVPHYVKEQTARRAADASCQILHPERWIRDERFEGYQSGDPNAPKKSKMDILCEEIGIKLGRSVSGAERPSLSECLSEGLTRDEIMKRLDEKQAGTDENFTHFLYSITDQLNRKMAS